MAVTINASTSAGLVTSADTSGDLNIQSGGSTKIAVTSAGANIIGTLTVNGAAPAYGKVLQVVNATFGTYVTTASSTYADTGITASITPTSSTSKVLVLVSCAGCGKSGANTGLGLKLLRGASVLITIDNSAGYNQLTSQNDVGSVTSCYLDSPATTSSTTYKIQFANINASGTAFVNDYLSTIPTSTITLMEIAA